MFVIAEDSKVKANAYSLLIFLLKYFMWGPLTDAINLRQQKIMCSLLITLELL